MVMTKPEIKAEWVRRLRSGKYKQGIGALCNYCDGVYCVLGVLAEIAAEQGVCTVSYVGQCKRFDKYGVFLPPSVKNWAGLRLNDGSYKLVCKSDRGVSFPEIADIIEFHPKGLFTWEEGQTNDQSNRS